MLVQPGTKQVFNWALNFLFSWTSRRRRKAEGESNEVEPLRSHERIAMLSVPMYVDMYGIGGTMRKVVT